MEERWTTIVDYPRYLISNTGLVMNDDTGRLLSQSYNPQGAVKVGLYSEGGQHTKSVKVLVAVAFVEGHTDVFDTPINLDGDQSNNNADNIAWRPRWFAWQYTRQFLDVENWYLFRKVYDIATNDIYEDMVDAAKANGLLLRDILKSVHDDRHVTFPTWQRFGIVL